MVDNMRNKQHLFGVIGIFIFILAATGYIYQSLLRKETGSEKYQFLEHLRVAHAIEVINSNELFMARARLPIYSCIFEDELHVKVKETLDTFERFMNDIVNFPVVHQSVNDFEQCPEETHIFLRIHNEILTERDFMEYHHNVSKVKGIVPRQGIEVLGWGGAQKLSDGKRMGILVNSRQIYTDIPDDGVTLPFVKAILLQELFQSYFIGNDFLRVGGMTSIQEETYTAFTQNKSDYIKEDAIDFMKHTAIGLCKFDVMSILALRDHEVREDYFDYFIERTSENYQSILEEAERIILNPSIASILDSRCV